MREGRRYIVDIDHTLSTGNTRVLTFEQSAVSWAFLSQVVAGLLSGALGSNFCGCGNDAIATRDHVHRTRARFYAGLHRRGGFFFFFFYSGTVRVTALRLDRHCRGEYRKRRERERRWRRSRRYRRERRRRRRGRGGGCCCGGGGWPTTGHSNASHARDFFSRKSYGGWRSRVGPVRGVIAADGISSDGGARTRRDVYSAERESSTNAHTLTRGDTLERARAHREADGGESGVIRESVAGCNAMFRVARLTFSVDGRRISVPVLLTDSARSVTMSIFPFYPFHRDQRANRRIWKGGDLAAIDKTRYNVVYPVCECMCLIRPLSPLCPPTRSGFWNAWPVVARRVVFKATKTNVLSNEQLDEKQINK